MSHCTFGTAISTFSIRPHKHETTIQFDIVQLTDRTRGTFGSFKFYHAATFGTPIWFCPHIGPHHFANFVEHILQVLPSDAPRQVSNKDACAAAATTTTRSSGSRRRSSGSRAATTTAVSAATAATTASVSPAATATATAAATAPASGGGDLAGTLATLEGPGQVWGADGIAVGKEENDLKGYENFGKFAAALASTGVASELSSGEYTIFAPTDPALESYELLRGPLDAKVVKQHIVKGRIASADVPSADLTDLNGEKLTYRYAVRKHFVNDAIIGEKTFGPYSDYPIDVSCSNGVVHSVGLCFAFY